MVCGRTFPLSVEPGILLQTCTWRLIKSFSYSVELAIKQQLLDYTPTYHHDKEKPHQRAHVVLTQKGRTCVLHAKKKEKKTMPAAAYQTRSVAIIWSLQGESEINWSVLELYWGASHDQVMQFCLDIVRLWQKPESLFIKTPKCSRHLPSFPCSWPFSTCNENTRQECHISPRPGSSANVSSFEKKRFIYNHKPKKEKECCQENNTEHPQGSCIYRNFCASTCNCEWSMTALLWFLTLVICF